MILRVLVIAPDLPGIDSVPELRAITAVHQASVLSGRVTCRDVYQQAREQPHRILHFAAHSSDDVVRLSGGEFLTPEDVAQIGRLTGAELVFFNSCRSGLLANYAVRHGLDYAVYCNVELQDAQAWKMPEAFYDFLLDQPQAAADCADYGARYAADYAAAFHRADSGQGVYGLAVSPQMISSWQTILAELKRHRREIDALRHELDHLIVAQRVTVVVLAAAAVLALSGLLWN